MKRFAIATVVSLTTSSLTTTAASAQITPGDLKKSSQESVEGSADGSLSSGGEGTEGNVQDDASGAHQTSHNIYQSSYDQSSADGQESSDGTWDGIFGSSYDFDEDREWDTGSSADVLIAGLIAFGIAAFNGFIPGIEVPSIPGL